MISETFVSLLGSSIITFFAITFLYIFDVFQERTNTAINVAIILILNAMVFTIIFFIVHFKVY